MVALRFLDRYTRPGDNRISIWPNTLKLIHDIPVWYGFGYIFPWPIIRANWFFPQPSCDHAHCDYLDGSANSDCRRNCCSVLFSDRCRGQSGLPKMEDCFDVKVCLVVRKYHAILVHSIADFNFYLPANALVCSVVLALCSKGKLTSPRTLQKTNDQRFREIFPQNKNEAVDDAYVVFAREPLRNVIEIVTQIVHADAKPECGERLYSTPPPSPTLVDN